jgi:hypothetical protein
MSLRVSLALAVLATALGCRSRETGTSSPPSVSDAGSPTAPPSRPTQPPPPPIAVLGPWQVAEARAAAVSPALWLDGAVRSVVAIPADDARSAEMRWLRWSDGSATVVARHAVRWMPPGSAMSLVPRVGGATAVWPTGAGGDAGAGWRAIDLAATGFVGEEREATALEVAASEWALTAMGRRSREGVDEPAPTVTRASVALRVEPRRAAPVALMGEVELTRGDDLMGFERALGLDPDDAAGRWAALSRGRCQDARLELYRVQRDSAEFKGAVAIGREVGVRWISVDAGPSSVVVSWYQDLIPMRLQCTRGTNAPTVADQGLRVALFPR